MSAEVERVLAEHWGVDVDNGGDQTEFYCDGCKETLAVGSGVDLDAPHRAHVAAALSAAGCLRDDREGETRERLERAVARLQERHDSVRQGSERSRLFGKIEGVKLAMSYLEELDRTPVTPDGGDL